MNGEVRNLLRPIDAHVEKFGVTSDYDSATGIFHVHGTLTDKKHAQSVRNFATTPLAAGEYVSLSLDKDLTNTGVYVQVNSINAKFIESRIIGLPDWHRTENTQPVPTDSVSQFFFIGVAPGRTVDVTFRAMLVKGTTPAAWAPAEGESLAGGGALMSANLWSNATANRSIRADGTYLSGANNVVEELSCQVAGLAPLTENQTVHIGASLKNAGAGVLKPFVGYRDAAGNMNWVGFPSWQPTDSWQRFEGTCVVPSGMTITYVGFNNSAATGDIQVANPVFSYGSPVPLASSAHTPYATQDHVSVTYATKAALKVTSDAVTAELNELNGMRDTVAPTEDAGAASRNYAVGEFFYDASHNLCRVTHAVSQGASLVSGTNYTTVSGGVQQYIGTPTYVYATAPSEATVKAAHATPCFVYVVDTASFYYVS